jgi:hypothetical protein
MSTDQLTVLLHGLGKDRQIMEDLERSLIEASFDVYNLSYPSKTYPIAELAQHVADRINKGFKDRSVNFVTHSLGSIVVRYISQHKLLPHIHRVVMLGPPNKGTAIINKLRDFKWFSNYWGPAATELSSDDIGIHNQLIEEVDFECGIIAGNKSADPWFSWTILKGEDDGKVTVDSTKIAGMKDHTVLPVTHPTMPKHPDVIEQTINFLKHGRFDKA